MDSGFGKPGAWMRVPSGCNEHQALDLAQSIRALGREESVERVMNQYGVDEAVAGAIIGRAHEILEARYGAQNEPPPFHDDVMPELDSNYEWAEVTTAESWQRKFIRVRKVV